MPDPMYELKMLCDSTDCDHRTTCAVNVEGTFTTFHPTFKIKRTTVEDRITCVSYRMEVVPKKLRLIG